MQTLLKLSDKNVALNYLAQCKTTQEWVYDLKKYLDALDADCKKELMYISNLLTFSLNTQV